MYYLPFAKSTVPVCKKPAPPLFSKTYWKVWLKLAEWFWRKRLSQLIDIFSLYCYYLLFWMKKDPSSESVLIVSNWFVLRLIKIETVLCFWRRSIFTLFYYLSLKRVVFHYLNKLKFPLPKNCLLLSLLKYEKFTMYHDDIKMTTTMPTDNGQV